MIFLVAIAIGRKGASSERALRLVNRAIKWMRRTPYVALPMYMFKAKCHRELGQLDEANSADQAVQELEVTFRNRNKLGDGGNK